MTPPPPPPPNLSPPIIFTPPDFISNPTLTASVLTLVNTSFHRSKAPDPIKWDNTTLRFPSEDMFHMMLGTDGVMALIFDLDQDIAPLKDDEAFETMVKREPSPYAGKKVIACAAAVPWKGGWAHESPGEAGWEMKIVCVDGGEAYLHRGLAIKVMGALENLLIEKERLRRRENREYGRLELELWILAAECINGVYWRKRGYEVVRKKTEGKGVWSCRTEFEMVVLRKVVRDGGW
jgi:hypothetical protein